jgi:hypothetical protein
MENHIKTIFEKSGLTFDKDNRSFQTKAVNECIENGMVKVSIQENGKIWTNPKFAKKDGTLIKFNLEVRAFGLIRRAYINGIDINDVLENIGGILNDERVKVKIGEAIVGTYYFESCACSRCNGNGVIPQFSYYCAGICFSCYGAGRSIRKVSI